MHGLINRTIQSFTCHTYGHARWLAVTEAAGLDFSEFEAMLTYDEDLTRQVLSALCADLDRDETDVLEDLGTFLVSNPNVESLRRLLRFGGVNYTEFLHSLDDLPDRARLAVSDLNLPKLELREHAAGQYSLTCRAGLQGFGSVMQGVLRAMADDYGALVVLDHHGGNNGAEVIDITVIESAWAKGRSFDLGAGAG
ncbi:MAG: heme NO-binding domain-containing protein [Rhodobacteraceae bacterium]|nr:heme NO-binding domain-containing protein [Paracoccaceae bacterium]